MRLCVCVCVCLRVCYARRVSRSLLHLRRRFSRRRLCRNARTYNYALPLIKIHGGIMCLSVHARPSSFRLACTRSLARWWSEREATEREKERERNKGARRRRRNERTERRRRMRRKIKKKEKGMEVGRGWSGTRYTHTQHNNIPAIIRCVPHVCHCCATLSVMRVHRVHRRRINEKRECRGGGGGLLEAQRARLTRWKKPRTILGPLHLMKVKEGVGQEEE